MQELFIRVQLLERVVANLPGASGVDLSAIRVELKKMGAVLADVTKDSHERLVSKVVGDMTGLLREDETNDRDDDDYFS
ncbi:hypothetical protein [Chenggangzhangella methanolivorans]|uniref:Uncharacterized protein n=2 Tax=Chenggangzhangella methanolivorans TaxID=1437009 RepID=A0A9E6RBB1_9HYPH|nr:hypothetical protein [Chenggangzhangella methanolivorans]QZO01613.1 hypothetical protein K6K41_09530 [Chenggangzhangella methanolivorans]